VIIRDVRVEGRPVDVRVEAGVVAGVAAAGTPAERRAPGAQIDGRGGALIPGLHDHHAHLLATAAAEQSVDCGPPQARTAAGLARALRAVPATGWVRGVGYEESVAGELDRRVLDGLIADRSVRVQHRGGSLWVINSLGLDLLGSDAPADGLLWRRDEWLRERLGDAAIPSLDVLGRRLASYGITGVTDATPGPPACSPVRWRSCRCASSASATPPARA